MKQLFLSCLKVVGLFSFFIGVNLSKGSTQTISTIAGTGMDFLGDSDLATSAGLFYPSDLALDYLGNLYIADFLNYRIRKIDPNGIITTVAGNGNGVFNGDNIPASTAGLTCSGIELDTYGNLYIADGGNNRIRKVDIYGNITTVAGNGIQGYSGDGKSALLASFNDPFSVKLDEAGNLYICDRGNNRIRKVNSSGIVTTIAGDGRYSFRGDNGPAINASFRDPESITLDANGNLIIADASNNRIRKINKNGIISTIAGNGNIGFGGDGVKATSTSVSSPSRIAFDSHGNLYIADLGNSRIRMVDINGIITTVAGNGKMEFNGDSSLATKASLNSPTGVLVDNSGNLFIADQQNNRIRKVSGVCLPLKINEFTVKAIHNYVTIKWQTNNEVNTDYFYIQKSTNGINFYNISKEYSKGITNNNYSHIDIVSNINLPSVYYRIKEIDNDGNVSYSKIVMIKIND